MKASTVNDAWVQDPSPAADPTAIEDPTAETVGLSGIAVGRGGENASGAVGVGPCAEEAAAAEATIAREGRVVDEGVRESREGRSGSMGKDVEEEEEDEGAYDMLLVSGCRGFKKRRGCVLLLYCLICFRQRAVNRFTALLFVLFNVTCAWRHVCGCLCIFFSQVISEAMKEEAKGRFQGGDFMGAAKVLSCVVVGQSPLSRR